MPTVSFQAPTDYTAEQAAIERQRRLAEALRMQAQQPMDTNQMAGGWVVPVSPYAGLAKMLQGYNARKTDENATERERALAERRRTEGSADVRSFMEALQGTPAREAQTTAEPGNDFIPGQDAVPGDRKKALAIALQSQNPMVAGAGQSMLSSMLKADDPYSLREGERRYGPGGAVIAENPKPLPGFTLSPGQQRMGPDGKPIAALPESFTMSPGQVRVSGGQPVASLPSKTPADELKAAMVAAGVDPAGPEGMALFKSLATKQATHQPSASNNVTIKQEGAEAGAVGKNFGEEFSALQKNGVTAGAKIANLTRMESLLDGVKTGKLTPIGTDIAALADSLGISIDKNLGNKQAALALSNQIALTLRSTADGGGMPGAMSDADREFLRSMTPGLAKTPEGNKQIIETAKKVARREQEVARLARDYRQKNGHMDEGFYNALQEYADKNPLFEAPKRRATDGGTVKFLGFESK